MPLDILEEPKQKIQLDFLGPLPAVCGADKYIVIWVDRCSNLSTTQVTTRSTAGVISDFLENYNALHAIQRVFRTDHR